MTNDTKIKDKGAWRCKGVERKVKITRLHWKNWNRNKPRGNLTIKIELVLCQSSLLTK